MSNAAVNFAGLTGSIVAVFAEVGDGRGECVGYGFGSIGRYAHTELIKERFAPRLLNSDPSEYCDEEGRLDPVRVEAIMRRDEKPGGHGERPVAIGAVDMAVWDLIGKLERKPVFQILSERFNGSSMDNSVSVYAAGGYYYGDGGLGRLKEELEGYLSLGYDAVKIKIGAGSVQEDRERIEAAIDCVGEGASVAVDANGRYDCETAIAVGEAIEGYGLRWYEEAGDPLDYRLQNSLGKTYKGALATGENLFSIQDVRNLIRYGGMRPDGDVLQMDPGLSYGIPEYVRMLGFLESNGWSRRRCFPHGGNLFNLHVAQGLQLGGTEAYPGVFEPFGGFGDDVSVCEGRASLSNAPGIGWESKPELMDWFLGME
jgi:D(-)-tartrate dehydratase